MIPEGTDAISPAPHHDIYSIEDLRQLVYSLKEATNYTKPVIVKIAAVHNVSAIASSIARSGADIIAIDGFRGGTGAAPTRIRDHVGIPIELALASVDKRLRDESIRNNVSIVAGGSIRSSADGIVLSNGPGDPADNPVIINNIRQIINSPVPIFGICLGHQLLALSHGFKTKKLKYGHRGFNHPVKDISTGLLYTTSQNHGYYVTNESVDESVARICFINLNDNTCEGLQYLNSPAFSVQFHPEGSAGPQDTGFLFDSFMENASNYAAGRS